MVTTYRLPQHSILYIGLRYTLPTIIGFALVNAVFLFWLQSAYPGRFQGAFFPVLIATLIGGFIAFPIRLIRQKTYEIRLDDDSITMSEAKSSVTIRFSEVSTIDHLPFGTRIQAKNPNRMIIILRDVERREELEARLNEIQPIEITAKKAMPANIGLLLSLGIVFVAFVLMFVPNLWLSVPAILVMILFVIGGYWELFNTRQGVKSSWWLFFALVTAILLLVLGIVFFKLSVLLPELLVQSDIVKALWLFSEKTL